MDDSSDASGDLRSSTRRRRRRSDDDESSLRYMLRNQNLLLVVFLILGVLTVSCACVAIVAAVVEHFWTSIDEPMGTAIAAEGVVDDGRKQQGGKSSSAEFVMQRQSEADGANRAVFCFINYTAAPGSPHRFVVDNVSADLCDALVFVSVGLDTRQQSARFKQPVEDAETLQSLTSLPTPVWVLVGGELADSRDFRKAVREKRTRLAFVHNAAVWSRRMGLAGLILYWKYPTLRYRSNYSTFVNTMRIVFEHKGLRLSVVVPWETAKRRDGYFVPSLYNRLDLVVVDTHRTVDPASFPVTTCQSPMRAVFRAHHNGQVGLSSVLDELSMVTEHMLGKTMLSVSFTGATFTLKRPWMKNVRVGMRVLGPGKPFAHTNRSGLASYYEVAKALTHHDASSWHSATHGFSRCSVAYWKDQWVGFEDRASLRLKRSVVRKTAGLAVWDLSMDDFAGDLGLAWPLLREAHDVVHG
ncbi:chitinase-like protein 3 [Dermacentor andersoni]|uniref:chitinase-like protein 3 n=1 Tax=Dermacentor andersoni TaxID=34620 RepID=UPI00215564CB|nr:endochitinase-like [Dermacentor andersoni]